MNYYKYLILIIIISACGPFSIKNNFSTPYKTKVTPIKQIKKIVIVSTNNLEGKLSKSIETVPLPDSEYALNFNVGGEEAMTSYFNILHNKYKNNLVLLDAGHLFGEYANVQKKSEILKLYKKLSYDAVLFTQKELFDIKIINSTKINYSFINSNILELKEKELFQSENILPSKIITRNGLKIGIIGVTDYQAISITDKKKLSGVYFKDIVTTILNSSYHLQKKNVNLIILLAHTNSKCQNRFCSPQAMISTIVERIPPGTVDLIVSSEKLFLNQKINKIPVLQNEGNGKFFSMAELYWDLKTKKVLPKMTQVYQATKLCHQFLVDTNDCHPFELWSNDLENLSFDKDFKPVYMPSFFLGKQVNLLQTN